jgi:hypothetical protein
VMAVAGVVLLLGGYVGSVGSICVAVNAEVLPIDSESPMWRAYVSPLGWYIEESGWPGADACGELMNWCTRLGDRIGGH